MVLRCTQEQIPVLEHHCGLRYYFPNVVIPVVNTVVFKHKGISWEWGIVLVESVLFFAGCEAWKWAKRICFRRVERKGMDAESGVI
jgi:Na+-exporting ATPase